MINVTFNTTETGKVKGKNNKLVIEVDLDEDNGPSKSGKTITIASTKGNEKIYDTGNELIFVGLNVYKYPPKDGE